MLGKKIKISAIVVGRNEASKLKACLDSLNWCDEILYADLDSSDQSVEIAKGANCLIFNYKIFGPGCEYTQADLIHKVVNDWVLLLDPDEELSPELADDIIGLLPTLDEDVLVGSVALPWEFYFGKHRLKGTTWGYNNYKEVLINKNRFEIKPIAHYGRQLVSGFKKHTILRNGNNVLRHYWMDNIKNFVSKHHRYLKDEGADKYKLGIRISFFKILLHLPYQFYFSYIKMKGFRDGGIGLFLSLFWTYYIVRSYLSLYWITLKTRYKFFNKA